MANNSKCCWCGREYDWTDSSASFKGSYCSAKCEHEAKAAGKD